MPNLFCLFYENNTSPNFDKADKILFIVQSAINEKKIRRFNKNAELTYDIQ